MLYDGKYTFLNDLGSGGFGRVFLAQEAVSNRKVAIKQLHTNKVEQQHALIHEIKAVASVSHRNPNNIAYHHHFIQDGLLFLVMEYCEGGSLRQRLITKDYKASDVLKWALTLTESLAWLHAEGLVHNDIKPDNLLQLPDGTLKISDFGMANLSGGTVSYLPPDRVVSQGRDPRVDVYAVGITILELLLGRHPFAGKSPAQVTDLLDQGKLPVSGLAAWQQSFFLKATQRSDHLRFQTMQEMAEAIRAQHVPLIIDHQALQTALVVERAKLKLRKRQWKELEGLTQNLTAQQADSIPLLKLLGQYQLYHYRPKLARPLLEKALRLNPRLDVQKELAWINLDEGHYAIAISLLSDHLHRNPSDYEAYNLLLQCYWRTERYETAAELALLLVEQASGHPCFINNYLINKALLDLRKVPLLSERHYNPAKPNPFVEYNYSVLKEPNLSHGRDQKPALSSKLLFQDFRFGKSTKPNPTLSIDTQVKFSESVVDKTIITIGRRGYHQNDIQFPGRTVSRRHCLIINAQNDVWLYDLNSTGTYLDGERIVNRALLTGKHRLGVDEHQIEINIDKGRLL